jgi:hypothetical protein
MRALLWYRRIVDHQHRVGATDKPVRLPEQLCFGASTLPTGLYSPSAHRARSCRKGAERLSRPFGRRSLAQFKGPRGPQPSRGPFWLRLRSAPVTAFPHSLPWRLAGLLGANSIILKMKDGFAYQSRTQIFHNGRYAPRWSFKSTGPRIIILVQEPIIFLRSANRCLFEATMLGMSIGLELRAKRLARFNCAERSSANWRARLPQSSTKPTRCGHRKNDAHGPGRVKIVQ